MRPAALACALGAFAVTASPTRSLPEPPSKRASVPHVTVSGNAFWADGERFYIRGIDYQPGGASGNSDPLSDPAVCRRDIDKFKKLGINSVRIYMVDNSADHDECMTALADAGIYLLLDLNTPKYSINRAQPFESYNTDYLQSVFATVDEFARFDNTLLFFSGNEVINDEPDTTKAAPFVKAVTRDVKAYIRRRNYRAVPVGYSAADVSDNRLQTAHYMNCGSDDERSDFFAFNDYSWCNTDFMTSGWDQKVKNFTDYGLPIFLSEWGCFENGRDFGEIEALMSPEMTGVYSGGLLYEYSMEANGFGIVEINGNEVEELDGFKKFASALSKWPAPSGSGGAASATHAVACPTMDSVWEVDPTKVPAMPTQAASFWSDGAGEGPGLGGGGSQSAVDSGVSESDDTSGDSPGNGDGGDDENSGVRLVSGSRAVAVTGLSVLFLLGAM